MHKQIVVLPLVASIVASCSQPTKLADFDREPAAVALVENPLHREVARVTAFMNAKTKFKDLMPNGKHLSKADQSALREIRARIGEQKVPLYGAYGNIVRIHSATEKPVTVEILRFAPTLVFTTEHQIYEIRSLHDVVGLLPATRTASAWSLLIPDANAKIPTWGKVAIGVAGVAGAAYMYHRAYENGREQGEQDAESQSDDSDSAPAETQPAPQEESPADQRREAREERAEQAKEKIEELQGQGYDLAETDDFDAPSCATGESRTIVKGLAISFHDKAGVEIVDIRDPKETSYLQYRRGHDGSVTTYACRDGKCISDGSDQESLSDDQYRQLLSPAANQRRLQALNDVDRLQQASGNFGMVIGDVHDSGLSNSQIQSTFANRVSAALGDPAVVAKMKSDFLQARAERMKTMSWRQQMGAKMWTYRESNFDKFVAALKQVYDAKAGGGVDPKASKNEQFYSNDLFRDAVMKELSSLKTQTARDLHGENLKYAQSRKVYTDLVVELEGRYHVKPVNDGGQRYQNVLDAAGGAGRVPSIDNAARVADRLLELDECCGNKTCRATLLKNAAERAVKSSDRAQ